MAADPQPQEVQPNDLFGRWLAHHEQQVTDDEPSSESGPEGARTEPAPAPRTSRRLPAAAVASSAVANDPVIGGRIAPPSDFGARRAATHGGTANELDREPPPGWEPIIMRSARKKTEKSDPSRVESSPLDRPGRLARLKARLVDPPEPVDHASPEADPALPSAVLSPAALPSVARTTLPTALITPPPASAPAAPPAPATRSIEETIRAAVAPLVEPAQVPEPSSEPVITAAPIAVRQFVEPVVEPEPVVQRLPQRLVGRPRPPEPVALVEPEPVVVAEPEPVVVAEPVVEPEPEPEPEPETIEADPEPDPVPEPPPADQAQAAPVAAPTARKSFRLRSTRTSGPAHKARTRAPRAGDAARDLVAAKAAARAASPVREPERRASAAAVAVEPEPVAVTPIKEQLALSKHDEVAAQMPGVYKFVPKRSVRRVLSLFLLAGMAASAYFVRVAIQVKETPAIGLATIIVLATAVVWAIRAGASVTTLTVRQGHLEVLQQGGKFVFDMASEYTMVEVHGEPGKRGWKVLFPRRGMAPFAVDATMVDPDDFMRVLRFFRPSLVHH